MSQAEPLQPSASPIQEPTRHEHRVNETRKLLTVLDICAEVGCSRWTWHRWVKSGQAPLPVPGLPGHAKWRRLDVDRWMRGRAFLHAAHRGAAQG